ncbi:SREBP regulating gene protein isoform X2 [Balaenoptera ricei]|uniref:SREBP regulating gene protein isoform X2 n=1 Tax=Balaenoptera ricei TaxID=2746895 RepID=UPI0028BDEC45|nr:SREBP regulating gene protein isoform X2 [Balaenoptera ricei]
MPPGPRACPASRRDGEPGGHGVAAAPAEEEERAVRDRNLLQVQDHDQPIPWKVQFNLGNSSRPSNQCRNSIQGKHLITDELGYVCERKDLLVNGCCNVNVPGTKQYCCDGCLSNGCCSAYEYCVSCCLQPNKQLLLERFLNRAAVAFQNLFMAVEDHFELCLAKCRTSSQSHLIQQLRLSQAGPTGIYANVQAMPKQTDSYCPCCSPPSAKGLYSRGLTHLSSEDPVVHSSSQLFIQQCHVGSLKLAAMGVFTP